MSIREANRRDGDGRNSDGCGEEKEGGGHTQTDERAGERWNGGGLS